jgi:hypothetical protein
MPTRLTDEAEPIPVGDEADMAGPAKEVPLVPAQIPDAVPVVPPPSNTEIELDVSAMFVPDVVPVELGGEPKDVCGSEPPMPEHRLLVTSACGDVPDIVELTPGEASSVAPKGTPVGATGEPGPIPSGVVMPSGDPGEIVIPPTCAKAATQLRRTAAAVAITTRVIIDPHLIRVRRTPDQSNRNKSTHLDIALHCPSLHHLP